MSLYISIIGLAVLLIVNYMGKRKGMYKKGQENFWFGKFMHFFGGFFVAMFWSGLIDIEGYRISLIFILTLLVGAIWEIGEYFYGIYKFKTAGAKDRLIETRDTVEDLILDILGAAFLLFFVYKF